MSVNDKTENRGTHGVSSSMLDTLVSSSENPLSLDMGSVKVQFSIAGNPQGKARPRFSRGHAYTPDATKKYENMTAFLYRRAANGFSFDKETPISVTILVYFSVPKSASKKKKEVMLHGGAFPVRKPDADNIAKIILDALNGTAYHDDAQIVQLSVRKQYAEKNSVEVILEDICQREK